MELLCESAIRAFFTFLAGVGVAIVGLQVFYKQKEFELVKQRYLEGAIDVAASDIEESFNALSYNWSRCLFLLKMFRDLPDEFDAQELQKGFRDIQSTQFNRIAFHRIHALVRDDDIWTVYQLALAHLSSANTKITSELPEAIRLKLSGDRIQRTPVEIAEIGFSELKELDEESHKYAEVVRVFQRLAAELEKMKPNFSTIENFHKRENVKAALADLRATFAKEIREQAEKVDP